MLYELVNGNRASLVARVRDRASMRLVSPPAADELALGIGTFLSQLSDLLFLRHVDPEYASLESGRERLEQMSRGAGLHGDRLQRHGFTLAQVVHDYSAIGRCIVELATAQGVSLSHDDVLVIAACVEAAISGAITEHASAGLREHLGALGNRNELPANHVARSAAPGLATTSARVATPVRASSGMRIGSPRTNDSP